MNSKKLIGIFATDVSAGVQGNLYTVLHEKAMNMGYTLVLFSGSYETSELISTSPVAWSLFSLAENMDFVAFFIHAQSIGNLDLINRIITMGKSKQIPIFVYDGETVGFTKTEGVISIEPDYKQGFAEGVKHLIEYHHCKNIFMLAGIKDNKYSDDRIEMYRREMESHGIDYCEEQIGYGDFWEDPSIEAVNRFLDSDLPTPEAICCANDTMAIAAAKVLRKRGYRVPEDILVTGFDGIEDGKFNFPGISTCEPKLEAVADFVFDILSGKESTDEFLIPLVFYPKESCGCASGNIMEIKREIPRLFESMRLYSWQHHMVATMQFELIDSCVLEELTGYMNGILDLFKSYSHLFCFRDGIECEMDYKEPFEKMRVFLNQGFLEDKEYDTFSVDEIIPGFDRVIADTGAEDMVFFKLIHSGEKKYGYFITRVGYYSSNELRILGHLSESVTIVVESILRNIRLKHANQKLSEMYERMSEIYIRDTMTGLYNRHGYYRCLEEYVKREDLKDGFIHVISIDMDGMKSINDGFGHLEGDNAIKAVAQAINECFAKPCISARFGGDEFVVAIFTEDDNEPTSENISFKLNDFLNHSPLLTDKEYNVGVSVGQAVVKLSEIEDMKTIEKMADDCMYEDKRKRKNYQNQI